MFTGRERGILRLDRFLSGFAFIFSYSPIADGLCLGPASPLPLFARHWGARSAEPLGFKSLFFMAERGGFEPPHGNYPPAGIRSQSLQPLGYLSTNDIPETNDQ